MTKLQQIIIKYLKAQYGESYIVTIRENDDPSGNILFSGTVADLESYYQNK